MGYPYYLCRMLEEFLQYLTSERRFSPLTVSNYRRDVERFTHWLEESGGPSDPRAIAIDDLRAWIVHRSEQGLSAASINRELSSLRSFFRYLQRRELIRRTPAANLRALKTPQRLPSFVPSTRMQTLLEQTDRESGEESFDQVRDALIVQLFYSCGLRLAELIAIDRDDFTGDFTGLKVRGKGDKERLVPILRSVREKILHYLEKITRQRICISQEKALFLTQEGRRISRSTVYRIVRRELRQSGVQGKTSPHVLRHTFATELLNNGADMREIQELMGHASLKATQVYTHNSIDRLQEVYSRAHPHEKRNGKKQQ